MIENKTLVIHWKAEQLPILPVEPEAHLSFTTHAVGNELELTGNRTGLLLLAKAALGIAFFFMQSLASVIKPLKDS